MKANKMITKIYSDLMKSKWIIFGLFLYWVISHVVFHEFCPMRLLTGLPCPGCGITRAVILFITGHFTQSFSMHPLALPWILLGLYFCICRYILDCKPKGIIVIGTGLCIAMIIVYIIRMMTVFPDQPPMTYTPNPLGDLLIALVSRHNE